MRHRFRALSALLFVALTALLVTSPVGAASGTMDVHDITSCQFIVSFSGFSPNAFVAFDISGQPPSGTADVTDGGGFLDANGSGDFTVDVTGKLSGLTPQQNQGYHLKIVETISNTSQVIWVPCDSPDPIPTVPPTEPPTVPPTVPPTTPATATATTPATATATTPPTATATATTTATPKTTATLKSTVSTLPTTGSGPSSGSPLAIWALIGAASLLLLGAFATIRGQRR